jgi:antitoxin component of RelBE/YafQ-DinJ toxin-antitoxin module
MADAMVTARMPQSKKDAGNKILRELGLNASLAVNELYDCILETHTWPLAAQKKSEIDTTQLANALAFVDSIARVPKDSFIDIDYDQAKRQRLIGKGRATESDFQ